MKNRLIHVALGALVLAVLASGAAAQAQAVYRCGNAYSQSPCAEGRIVDAADPRSEAQRLEAERVAADERERGERLERLRLAQAAAERPTLAASLGPVHSATPTKAVDGKLHLKKKRVTAKPAASADFVAFDPSSRRHRRSS